MKKIILLLLPLFVTPLLSQQKEVSDEWSFSVTPYAWFTKMSGSIQALDTTIPIDVPVSSVLDARETSFMIHGEAQKGRWSAIVDYLYYKGGGEGQVESGYLDTDLEENILELGGGYLLINKSKMPSLSVIGGARYVSLDLDADLTPLEGAVVMESRTQDWVEPYIGVRSEYQYKRWIANTRMDIGGFGIGSDLTTKFTIGGGFEVLKWMDLLGGYQILDIDYDESDFIYDVQSEGFYGAIRLNF